MKTPHRHKITGENYIFITTRQMRSPIPVVFILSMICTFHGHCLYVPATYNLQHPNMSLTLENDAVCNCKCRRSTCYFVRPNVFKVCHNPTRRAQCNLSICNKLVQIHFQHRHILCLQVYIRRRNYASIYKMNTAAVYVKCVYKVPVYLFSKYLL